MKNYDHKKIEKKWQGEWEKKKIYQAKDPSTSSGQVKGEKFYGLVEFPYPSGDGLHVGHPRPYIGMDIISRKKRMEGKNVLFPIGWDAFGLPAENYAIKTGKQPSVITKKNSDNFRRQIQSLGISFDWSREINTTDPAYYKWTQWLFLQFLKKGLAYKAKSEINWCPKDKCGLANEEVIDGKCERCGAETIKKEKEQWMLGITKYADRLDKDLDLVDYPERVKSSQRNWIGRSEGAEVDFQIKNLNEKIKVFTTRIDTIFSGTFIVLAPEHPLVKSFLDKIPNKIEVEKYINQVKNKPDIERTSSENKTGVCLTGIYAINPATLDEMPIWVSDFVLGHYGTGAVFADAHDKRDFDMAKKYNILLKNSIRPKDDISFEKIKNLEECFEDEGILFNSKQFDGLSSFEARPKIIDWLEAKGSAKKRISFKLRDWVFSRQRYWGEPIPVVNCEKCGLVPVKEKDLPVKLPLVKSYKPTDSGESPLASISKWVNTKCPKCGEKAKRETDTMPNWAGSSWYYLRYTDPKNKKEFVSKKNLKYWTPVDWYNGGMEHTTLHLLYSRFWHKFLFDLKLVPTVEPYKKRTSHGMILGEGGVKMSKSLGNVVNPDEIVKTYGADTLRVYEMFIGPFEDTAVWNTESIIGSRRFIEKVWRIGEKITEQKKNSPGLSLGDKRTGDRHDSLNFSSAPLSKLLHKTIKKVGEDIEAMRFNTAISAMMILATEMEKIEFVDKEDFKKFLQILAPFAPHITDELWFIFGEKKSINLSTWPKYDEKEIIDNELKIVIQVNGKVRAEIFVLASEDEEKIKEQAENNPVIKKFTEGAQIKKIIYVKGRLVNIVV
ncbi:MAG: leucine--tRNA ligase [bacterium]